MNPAPEFRIEPSTFFELLKPLYGLSDAGDLWHQTLYRHLTKELCLIPTKIYLSSYFSISDGRLKGINGSYIDHLLRAGRAESKLICRMAHKRFEICGDAEIPITFAGFHITKPKQYPFSIDQNLYVEKLEELDPTSDYGKFRAMRMHLSWLSNTHPDLLFEISQLALIRLERFNESAQAHWECVNTAIRYAQTNITNLKFPKLT